MRSNCANCTSGCGRRSKPPAKAPRPETDETVCRKNHPKLTFLLALAGLFQPASVCARRRHRRQSTRSCWPACRRKLRQTLDLIKLEAEQRQISALKQYCLEQLALHFAGVKENGRLLFTRFWMCNCLFQRIKRLWFCFIWIWKGFLCREEVPASRVV